MRYEYTDRDGDEIAVAGDENGVIVGITNEREYNNILVAKEQAPALALAVLEAAGYSGTSKDNVGDSVYLLTYHVKEQAAAAAEAADREALEREAKAIYEGYRDASVFILVPWTELNEGKKPWLAAARAARKLHQKEAEQ